MIHGLWNLAKDPSKMPKLGALTPLFTRVSVSRGCFPGMECFRVLTRGLREWLCSSARRYVNAVECFSDTKYP